MSEALTLEQLITGYAQLFCGSKICSTNGELDKGKIDRLGDNVITMFCSDDPEKSRKAREILENEYPVMKYYELVPIAGQNVRIYLSFDNDGLYKAFVGEVPLRTLNSHALYFIESENGEEEG